MDEDKVACQICGKEYKTINLHLRSHKITMAEYRQKFPNAKLSSLATSKKKSKSLTGIKRSKETKRKLSESIKKSWKKKS